MDNKTDEKLLKAIVKELITIRKGKKITQAQVLNDTNIHVARIEQGKRNMAIITFLRLCEYYEIKPSVVMEKFEANNKL